MKKLFVVFFSILIATIIGTSFTKGNPEKTTEVASIYGNLYAFQIGVFQDKESAENIRKQYEGIIVEKDGLNYVYIGILSNTSNIERYINILDKTNIYYYVKLIPTNLECQNELYNYEELMKNCTSDIAFTTLVKQALKKYEVSYEN